MSHGLSAIDLCLSIIALQSPVTPAVLNIITEPMYPQIGRCMCCYTHHWELYFYSVWWQWLKCQQSCINIMCVYHEWEGVVRGRREWEGRVMCMYAIPCTCMYTCKLCIMHEYCYVVVLCDVCWHQLISILCVFLMLFLQRASHSLQPPHPLQHPLALMLPHKNLVSKALYSKSWPHITCDTKQWVHVLAILSATMKLHIL